MSTIEPQEPWASAMIAVGAVDPRREGVASWNRLGEPGEGLVFTNAQGRPMSRQNLSEAWRHVMPDAAGRSGWHDLRHHYASMLIAGGASVIAVARRLGHKDPTETLRTYGHLWHDDEAAACVVPCMTQDGALSCASWPTRRSSMTVSSSLPAGSSPPVRCARSAVFRTARSPCRSGSGPARGAAPGWIGTSTPL